MRVRILTSIAMAGGAYRRGQTVDLDDSTALDWISRGMAEQIQVEPVVEFAEAPSYETTAAPSPRRNRRR